MNPFLIAGRIIVVEFSSLRMTLPNISLDAINVTSKKAKDELAGKFLDLVASQDEINVTQISI